MCPSTVSNKITTGLVCGLEHGLTTYTRRHFLLSRASRSAAQHRAALLAAPRMPTRAWCVRIVPKMGTSYRSRRSNKKPGVAPGLPLHQTTKPSWLA